MKQILIFVFMLISVTTIAQNITSAEYFYNVDPGVGNGDALTVSSNSGQLTQTFSIPTTGLADGFHSLYFRTLNSDGNWSLYDRQSIYVKNFITTNITTAEYFFNTDPGVGNGTTLSVNTNSGQLMQTYSIPTSSLFEGFHSFYLRTLSSSNEWSLYDRQIIYIKDFDFTPDEVLNAEYFIDSDPGVGNGTAVVFGTPSQTSQVLNIDSTGLSEGDHLFYVRVQDANGDWSIYDTALFAIDSSLGIEDSLFKTISIYPNPFVESIEFSSTENLSIEKVIIYDYNGKKVYVNESKSQKINLSFLSQGVYILELNANNSKASFKIIKK